MKSSIVSALFQNRNWNETGLGPLEAWPRSLKSFCQMIFDLPTPAYLCWGKERILIYNDAYLPLLGTIKHPSAFGARFAQAWPEVRNELEPMMLKVDEGESYYLVDHPLTLERKGQKEDCLFNLSFSPLIGDSGTVEGLLCLCQERTAQVEAKLDFERSVDRSPAILWITRPDGYCTYLSEQWYSFTGQTSEEALGYGWLKATHPDDAQRSGEIFLKANDKQVPFSITYRLRDKDGQYRWAIDAGNPRFDAQGNFLGFAGSVIDIHDKLESENKLHELRLRFEKAAAATDLGVWYCDLPFDEMIWNQKVRDHFFITHDEVVTFEKFLQHVHPEDRERTQLAVDEAIGNGTTYDIIYRTRDPKNTQRVHYIRAIGWTDYDEAGKALRFDGITLNVTKEIQRELELKQAKEEAESARADAERANHLKSAFLANMSHEIRTPLGAMMGFADLLRDPGLTETERRSFIDILSRNGESLSVIINDILDLSKVEAGHLTLEYTDANPDRIAADIVSLLGVKAREKNLVLEYSKDESAPESIVSDPTRIRQILINLVGNAIKFTPFGSVKLRSYGCESKSGRKALCFEVADTGIGIAEDQKEKVFEMFVQADGTMTRKFGGTGLGLALSRKLARALGGEITLERTKEGQGTCFLIVIEDRSELRNVTSEGKEDPKNHALHLADDALEGVRVLVVDDAPDNQQLLWRYLTRYGAVVESADNGLIGYRSAITGDYDIVLMDIQMPVMDGYTATQKLRDGGYQRPIVALTAHAMSEVRKKALNVGCSDHLPKPINPQQLVGAMVKLLNR